VTAADQVVSSGGVRARDRRAGVGAAIADPRACSLPRPAPPPGAPFPAPLARVGTCGRRSMRTIGKLVAGRNIYHLSVEQSVRDAARYMTERRVGAVAVLEGERLAGILSERDIMSRVVSKGLDPERTKVGDVMTREIVVAGADDSHEDGVR